jgi:Transposase DDE domain group 1
VAWVRVGVADLSLTPVAGMAAVTELVDRLGVVAAVDAAVGPIKIRDRGYGAGRLLVGIAAAQLAGEDFLVGLDRQRADVAGQSLAPVPGLASTTATGLARRMTGGQWAAVETGVAAATARMLGMLPAGRAAALAAEVTVDLDTTDVEVYGGKKRGVAYNYQGQRCGRPHVATWAETGTVLAADLLAGDVDPRRHAAGLLRRALTALPPVARGGRVRMRADAGYFAGELARAAHAENVGFAIGGKRIAPLWRMLDGIAEADWTDATDMPAAQVAVAGYRPDWWPANTRLLIRRVRLDVAAGQVSADPRSRRRRTLHPDQRALPLAELAEAEGVYGYSFILTNLDVSTPDKTAAVEHWYRHRPSIENVFRDSKHGAALRHLPSGHPQVNLAWMWGALLAATIAGWLHQLTGASRPDGTLAGHGVRDGKA